MKNTLLLITLACFFACAKQTNNDQRIDIQVKEHIPATVIDPITGGAFFEIRVVDSMLVLLDRQNTNFFSVYSKRDHHKIKDFGEKGSGPFDYNIPFFVRRDIPDDTLSIFEFMKYKVHNYGLDQLVNNRATPSVTELSKEAFGYLKPHMCRDYVFFTNNEVTDGIIMRYNLNDKSMLWIKAPEEVTGVNNADEYRNEKLRCSFSVDCENDVIIVGLKHINKILFFNTNGEFQKAYTLGNETSVLTVNSDGMLEDMTNVYTTHIFSSKRYFYVLYHEDTLDKYESPAKADKKTKALIFEKNGTFVKTIMFDRYIFDGCIDTEEDLFYGIHLNHEDDSSVVSYKLNEDQY
ncbi:MAG: BF3164 family lipoprotein [Tannerellaceae bacterium]